jgi:hypothetical protein
MDPTEYILESYEFKITVLIKNVRILQRMKLQVYYLVQVL